MNEAIQAQYKIFLKNSNQIDRLPNTVNFNSSILWAISYVKPHILNACCLSGYRTSSIPTGILNNWTHICLQICVLVLVKVIWVHIGSYSRTFGPMFGEVRCM